MANITTTTLKPKPQGGVQIAPSIMVYAQPAAEAPPASPALPAQPPTTPLVPEGQQRVEWTTEALRWFVEDAAAAGATLPEHYRTLKRLVAVLDALDFETLPLDPP